ncbi:MAG: argininosuccinate lyase [Planctomycetes bacterium]|nr:argininosuccinate lyase [Planctomycetota bacterium]
MALWGSRFEDATDPLFTAINDSLRVDHRLVADDVAGSRAWAAAIRGAGVLSAAECARLDAALVEIAAVARLDPAAVRDAGDEDVHSWVERELIERVGDLGKKLHTGRSRNDQVATDLRLWTRTQIDARIAEIRDAQQALVDLARRETDTVLPGYTHLQRAQPVLFAHWCLAYVEMLQRDAARFADARQRQSECPLGAAALVGTAYPIDRQVLAESLGFDRPTANSLDAVSDRDFVVETIGAAALCAVHLSRIAEDLIFYNSGEAGFIELSDAVTSGSSLMPQKKNPDALELLRGKAGGLLGRHVSVAVMLKGLPLAYNKDMQEDKEPLFAAMDELSLCLRIVPAVLGGLEVRSERSRRAAEAGHSNATELADWLVGRGVPFRDAHDITGRVVRHAIDRGVSLEALTDEELASFAPQLDESVREHLAIEALLAKRDVMGGTAPTRVRAAIDEAQARLDAAVATAADREVIV